MALKICRTVALHLAVTHCCSVAAAQSTASCKALVAQPCSAIRKAIRCHLQPHGRIHKRSTYKLLHPCMQQAAGQRQQNPKETGSIYSKALLAIKQLDCSRDTDTPG